MKQEEPPTHNNRGRLFYIKGSGNSACLLTNSLEDQLSFVQLKVHPNTQDVHLAGLYAVSLSAAPQTQDQGWDWEYEPPASEVFWWGMLDGQMCDVPRPVSLGNLQVSEISCGWNHTLLKTSRGIYGFGENKYGQLNMDEEGKFFHEPVKLSSILQVTIAAGFRQSYWVEAGILWGCGETKNYELGMQEKQIQLPTMIDLGSASTGVNIRKMRCGKKFVVLLDCHGSVYGLGSNAHKVLSESGAKYLPSMTKIENEKVIDIAAGWSHCVFLHEGGRVSTRGRNNFGQLGRSEQQGPFVAIQQPCSSIQAGTQFSFAVTQGGKLYGWGWNEHMNIQNEADSPNITRPRLIDTSPLGAVSFCRTYPAITVISGASQNH